MWSKRVWVLTVVFTVMTLFSKVGHKTFWFLLGLFGCIWLLHQAEVQTCRGEVKVVLSENAAIKGDIQDASSTDLLARHAA